MRPRGSYLRSLDPGLSRSVWTLQLGSFANAFGNGVVWPFLLIYLHNVRGFGLGTAGLALAVASATAVVAGPPIGTLLDHVGARTVLALALVLSIVGALGYVIVRHPWQAFAAGAISGLGNAAFWPANSSMIAALTERADRHAAYAMQRVTNNLGIGIGGVVGGVIATTAHPITYETLFVVDAVTFAAYLGVLALVPSPPRPRREGGAGGYRRVLRDRVFLGFLVLDAFLIAAGFAWLQDLLPAFAKNHNGVGERAIGLIFLANTLVIVVVQLPIAKLLEGRRRMAAYAVESALWASSWLLVFAAGLWLGALGAAIAFAVAVSVFGVGECFHGTVRGAFLADLAEPALLGRYLALAAVSFQLGVSAGRAVGGFLLAATPLGTWLIGAAICVAGGLWALSLERRIPQEIRRTPRRVPLVEPA
jgi:MFS family permease